MITGSDQQTEIEGTMLQPGNDLESAIVITLDPGQYTAIMTGKESNHLQRGWEWHHAGDVPQLN